MNRKAVVREFCFAVLFLLLAVLLIGLTSTALRPVRTNYGAVWGKVNWNLKTNLIL